MLASIDFFYQLMHLFDEEDHLTKSNFIDAGNLVSIVLEQIKKPSIEARTLYALFELLNAMIVKHCNDDTKLDSEIYSGHH